METLSHNLLNDVAQVIPMTYKIIRVFVLFARFQDKLSINITDSQIQTVSLMAYGSGTTIASEPPLAPAVKLGPQFSCQPVKRWFRLTNSGRRPQQIYWTTEGFLPYRTKKKPEYNPDDMRFQVMNLDYRQPSIQNLKRVIF